MGTYRHRTLPRSVVALLVGAVALAACSGGSGSSGAGPSASSGGGRTGDARPGPTNDRLVELRPLHVADRRIVDDRGREVLLRGANVNALGDYAQADPAAAPTAPVTGSDWDEMASRGFSVVRLLLSWSSLEPARGSVDVRYLQRIRSAVAAANARGIYVVLDMHQDAWSKFAATPTGTACPSGTAPALGWDGAPEWATISDGATTCLAPGARRESAPAVQRAFANFYADTDGIADELTRVWGRLAREFRDVPGVAGYDLLNEPNAVDPGPQNQLAYSRWVQRTVDAIRAAEGAPAPPIHKPVFAEPLQMYPLPDNALLPEQVHDPDLVFAPHNYAESISHVLTVEQTFAVDQQGADDLDAALWIGEYGFWDTSPATLAVVSRYAAEEDRRALGGAWWQWRQTCGDPHSVRGPGVPADEDQVHLITRACSRGAGAPRDTDLRYTEEFLHVLGRAYPRAAPGHITSLVSDPDSGRFHVNADGATAGSTLVAWVPANGPGRAARPSATGLDDVVMHPVRGGHILTATAAGGDWSLDIEGR